MLRIVMETATPKKCQRREWELDGEKLAKVLMALGRFLLSIAITANVVGIV